MYHLNNKLNNSDNLKKSDESESDESDPEIIFFFYKK